MPTLTVGGLTSVMCTGKTASTFTGCSGLTANVPSGAAVTATVPHGTFTADRVDGDQRRDRHVGDVSDPDRGRARSPSRSARSG